MVLETLWSTTRTLYRRLGTRAVWADRAWFGSKWLWCRLHGLSLDITRVPRKNGGLGIEPAEYGVSYYMPVKLPKQEVLEGAIPLNQTKWRAERTRVYYQTDTLCHRS
jgi:hypothetical protein